MNDQTNPMTLDGLLDKIEQTMKGANNLITAVRDSQHRTLPSPQEKAGVINIILASMPLIIGGYIKEYIEANPASSLVLATSIPLAPGG
jgi:hypothetical protein